MFPLDASETLAFLHLARRLILSDGEVAETERTYLREVAQDLDLYRELDQPMSLGEAARRLERPEARSWVMDELARLAHRDGRVATSERLHLQSLGVALGFTSDATDHTLDTTA